MGISTLVDLVKIVCLSNGTGSFQLGPAVPGFRGIEALTDGGIYSYSVQYNSTFELGTGTYSVVSSQLIRTPLFSSAGNVAVAFPANVQISFVALSQDIDPQGSTIQLLDALGPSHTAAITQYAVTAAIRAIVNGTMPWVLPDEATGGTVPAAGSGLPYLSAGVLKIA